jgi:hypothetical protein
VKLWNVGGDFIAAAAAGAVVVGLVAPKQRIGPLRLVRVSVDGTYRSVLVARVTGGMLVRRPTRRVVTKHPALALDADRGVAYVVAAGSPIAEVDLATLEITYQPVRALAARTKMMEGSSRSAAVVGGVLAVAGTTYARVTRNGNTTMTSTPIGLRLVDPTDWSTRPVDRTTARVISAGSVLLATGLRSDRRRTPTGLTAYDEHGARLWHRFGGEQIAEAQRLGRRLYVEGSNFRAVRVVDAESGSVIATKTFGRPTMLFLPR